MQMSGTQTLRSRDHAITCRCVIVRRGWRGGGGAAIGAVGAAFYMNGGGGGGRPPQAYAGSGAGGCLGTAP